MKEKKETMKKENEIMWEWKIKIQNRWQMIKQNDKKKGRRNYRQKERTDDTKEIEEYEKNKEKKKRNERKGVNQ